MLELSLRFREGLAVDVSLEEGMEEDPFRIPLSLEEGVKVKPAGSMDDSLA